MGGDELEDVERRRTKLRRRYKIQEVIKRGQIILVQVVKEERGNKGAALTTYLSLPGRFCVLMPNTARGGGISRKITNPRDRKRLKKILDDIGIPDGMAVIVRTAGSERTKAEIKRDFEYMLRLWDTIRTDTLESSAPALIYEEANLIKRAIRDMYTKEIEEILIEGDTGYRIAKDFMRTLMPSHAKRVQPYKNGGVPVFQHHQVESQIDAIHSPNVKLRSGGYIVMHQTEALVAIDVNSGRATRERHIEETALKTNLEAAEEIARQLRLRDLAGLIVIDFIDMEDSRNNQAVERRLKDALRTDRARIQVGRISHFGLLEMSRQRLRPSLAEMSSEICQYCNGTGYIRSVEWTGLHLLRAIEEEALKGRAGELVIAVPTDSALYLLNHKRAKLHELEQRHEVKIQVLADTSLVPPAYTIDLGGVRTRDTSRDGDESGSGERPSRRKRRSRRRRRSDEAAATETDAQAAEEAETQTDAESEDTAAPSPDDGDGAGRRRKRGRRGGRRRNRRTKAADDAQTEATSDDGEAPATEAAPSDDAPDQPAQAETDDATAATAPETPATEDAATESDAEPAKKRRPRRTRRRAKSNGSTADTETAGDNTPDETEAKPAKKRRTRKTAATTKRRKKAETDEAPPADPSPEADGGNTADKPEEQQPELPVAATPAASDGPAVPSDEPKEKRTGWWNRVVG